MGNRRPSALRRRSSKPKLPKSGGLHCLDRTGGLTDVALDGNEKSALSFRRLPASLLVRRSTGSWLGGLRAPVGSPTRRWATGGRVRLHRRTRVPRVPAGPGSWVGHAAPPGLVLAAVLGTRFNDGSGRHGRFPLSRVRPPMCPEARERRALRGRRARICGGR